MRDLIRYVIYRVKTVAADEKTKTRPISSVDTYSGRGLYSFLLGGGEGRNTSFPRDRKHALADTGLMPSAIRYVAPTKNLISSHVISWQEIESPIYQLSPRFSCYRVGSLVESHILPAALNYDILVATFFSIL